MRKLSLGLISSSLSLLRRLAFVSAMLPVTAMAQSLPAGCYIGELGTLPLTFTANMLPLVEASINGNTVPAVLDIGLQYATSLDKTTLEKLGIHVRSSDSNYAGVQVMNSLIDRFAVGTIEWKRSWFVVEELPGDVIGAKIGANYLLRNDLEIALDDGYLKYFKPSGCRKASLAYWDQQAPSVPIDVDPLKKDLRPWFKVRINGKDISAVLSTASEHSYIDLYTAQRMGLTPQSPGAARKDSVISWYNRSQPVWSVPVPQMSIGDLEIKDFSLHLVNLDLSGEVMLLGADFLRRHRVYIAMSQRRIYFSPVNAKPVSGAITLDQTKR
jgi:predicted aspartyl protease